MASRNARETSAATRKSALPPVPPLLCDICEFGMSAHEIVRNPDGSIPGLLVCTLCVEDSLEARKLEMQP